ncbi:hypothetical protein [Tsukamurella sp. 1534]|uniref:hypothetical protein n=1 Tax=Tsukamurella sp. 1534 TaxID=1151061 RepID=UPI00031AC418|nr:hypothetical protein [Tsukamurella sp. 1534]
MTDFGSTTRRIALGAFGAAALAVTLPALASAAPKTDADLAKSVACAYAAQIAQHADQDSVGSSYGPKRVSERNGIYVVDCEVRVMKRSGRSTVSAEGIPPLIYRVTVDGNNRFFVTNAVGPNVPPVRGPGAPRAV